MKQPCSKPKLNRVVLINRLEPLRITRILMRYKRRIAPLYFRKPEGQGVYIIRNKNVVHNLLEILQGPFQWQTWKEESLGRWLLCHKQSDLFCSLDRI